MNLNNPIYYLKGISNLRASSISAELGLSRLNDLLHFFPYRYIDRTKLYKINESGMPQSLYGRIIFRHRNDLSGIRDYGKETH